jgi:hypothetical protein
VFGILGVPGAFVLQHVVEDLVVAQEHSLLPKMEVLLVSEALLNPKLAMSKLVLPSPSTAPGINGLSGDHVQRFVVED